MKISKKNNKIEDINDKLIPKLIYSTMQYTKSDSNFKIVDDFIKNFLRNNSLIYVPKTSEIKQKIKGLFDKFIVNSQSEKAKLIEDYIMRLETIFSEKNANMEYLYKFVLIIIELARSPLMTSVNLEILKEKFEDRHIRVDCNKILRNKKIEFKDMGNETIVKFESVNYASESSENESNEENFHDETLNRFKPLKSYSEIEKKIYENFNQNHEDFSNKIHKEDGKLKIEQERKKQIIDKILKYNNMKLDKFDLNYKTKLFYMFLHETKYSNFFNLSKLDVLYRPYKDDKNYNYIKQKIQDKYEFHIKLKLEKQLEMNSRFSEIDNYQNINKIIEFHNDRIKKEDFRYYHSISMMNIIKHNEKNNIFQEHHQKKYFDSDSLLISVLNDLISGKDQQGIDNKDETFIDKFKNYVCFNLDKNLQDSIIQDLDEFQEKILYLRNLDKLLKENNITSYIVFEFLNYISDINKCIQFILNSYLNLVLYQRGQIKNPLSIFLHNTDFIFYNKFYKFKYSDFNNKAKSDKYDPNENYYPFTLTDHFFPNIFTYENSHFYDDSEKSQENHDSANIRYFSEQIKTFLKEIKEDNFKDIYNQNKNYFQRVLEQYHNYNIIQYLDKDILKCGIPFELKEKFESKKFTILCLRDELLNFYKEKLDYLIIISENMIRIKVELDKLNLYRPYLFLKEFIDFVYMMTRKIVYCESKLKILLAVELFFSIIFSYMDIVKVFILNGNLIDSFNEFFLDHIFTKKDNSKIIYFFNEKFKDFDWFNSFKIKSYSLYEIEGGCVPEIFKIDHANFKILETGKAVFLIKNMKSLDKIKYDINLDEENLKMEKIRENVYQEIYKIVNLDSICEYNFTFYEKYTNYKFINDNMIDLKKVKSSPIINPDEFKKKKKYEKMDVEEEIILSKNLKKTEDLTTLKKNIHLNSQIEMKIYEILPYNSNDHSITNFTYNKNIDYSKIKENNSINEVNISNFSDNLKNQYDINLKLNFPNHDSNNLFEENYRNILCDEASIIFSKNDEQTEFLLMDIEKEEKRENRHVILEKIKNEEEKLKNSLSVETLAKKASCKLDSKSGFKLDFLNLDEIKELEGFISEPNNNKFIDGESIDLKQKNYIVFSIHHLFHNNIIKSIESVNKAMNSKLLTYLINEEKIKKHFELCFSIIFFRAGFSMHIFVTSLLEISKKGMISDNFFLKNIMNEISQNSDLKIYADFIKDYFCISINPNMVNNFDTFIIKYKPKLPVSIFYDDTINHYYSTIFNFIYNIKRINESFKVIMLEKKLDVLEMMIDRLELKILPMNIFKKLNYFKNIFFHIFHRVEFYIFHHCLNEKIIEFLSSCEKIKSIDTLINSHLKLLKELYLSIGLRENDLIKNLGELDTLIDYYKIIVSGFFNILYQGNDEYEQYKNLQDSSIEVLEFSKNLNKVKENIFEILHKLTEKKIS